MLSLGLLQKKTKFSMEGIDWFNLSHFLLNIRIFLKKLSLVHSDKEQREQVIAKRKPNGAKNFWKICVYLWKSMFSNCNKPGLIEWGFSYWTTTDKLEFIDRSEVYRVLCSTDIAIFWQRIMIAPPSFSAILG